ncbi:HAD hydrolase-like protein [bacterium]|nr:HAD hydrolase-like protein [bacterium]
MPRSPQTLLIDADDTLWENNIYFEQVIAGFVARLVDRGIPAARAQQVLGETEQRNVKVTGYGSQAFCQSLHEVARALGVGDLEPWIVEQEDRIFQHPIELMPGVRQALPRLQARHCLILLSKGRRDEQQGKLRRSGLAEYFHAVEIVFEKTVDTYRHLVRRHGLIPDRTWMVGNSPRSDVNPARAAGLRTVFIPHHSTWQHELE